jgi:lysophospholipase L1-like esterase
MILPNHKKLVVAGCSFTEGYGLSNPLTHSWPVLLANKLGLECVNLGFRGAGNEYISNKIIEYTISDDFQINPTELKNCFFIIAFTEYSRMDFGYHANKNVSVHLTPNSRVWPELCKTIYPQFYNDRYYFKKFLLQVLKAQSYFQINRLNYMMVNSIIPLSLINTRTKNIENIYQKINKRQFKNFDKINFNVIIQDGKFEDGHPNEIGHQRIADTLYKWLKEK